MSGEEFWEEAVKLYSELVPDDEARARMTKSYFDGGVSMLQIAELGGKRPGIPAFLRFAEKYNGTPFRAISGFGGLEFVFRYSEDFEKIGIMEQTLAACMDGHPEAIRLVCEKTLVSMSSARELYGRGETQLASRGKVINPTAVKAFILAVLDARERYQYHDIIPELYFLLSQVLLPGETEAEQAEQSDNLRTHVIILGWAYQHKHGEYPSYRKLAKLLGVAPSTVSRMFESVEKFKLNVTQFGMIGGDPSEYPALTEIYPHL